MHTSRSRGWFVFSSACGDVARAYSGTYDYWYDGILLRVPGIWYCSSGDIWWTIGAVVDADDAVL